MVKVAKDVNHTQLGVVRAGKSECWKNGVYSKWWVPALRGADMAQTTKEGISNEPWSTEGVGEGACSAAIATSTLQVGFYLTVLHRQPTGSPTLP